MKLNEKTKLIGENVILTPYCEQHVLRYHEWMKSEELQKLTGSEPLTLEQEYEMQKSWREDDDKCTFIILDKKKFEETEDEIGAMIGDTNIFLLDKDNLSGEIEIMIAEPFARGKKLGWEAVILMLLYGVQYLNIKSFEAKIAMINHICIRMFRKLKFIESSQSDVFQEVTFVKDVDNEWQKWLEKQYNFKIIQEE